MDIFIFRHADAVERGTGNDFDRPLTEIGREQSARIARSFPERGLRVDRLFVSPLVRAQQTAEPLAFAWQIAEENVVRCDLLAPGNKCGKLAKFIRDNQASSVGIVGHAPDVGEFAAWLIGSKKAQITVQKAGIALIRCSGKALKKGSGQLLWLLPEGWI